MKFKSRVKKLVVTTGMLLMLGLASTTTAYASGPGTQATQQQAVQQSDRWEGSGDTWRVRTQDGKGYLTNSWFCDNDGSWYMLGGDGVMYSGLITDQSTGKSYLLNTNHDGTYGRMLTTDGVYNINGSQVYLTFNQSHDGTYGAVQTGLLEVRNSGVKETQLATIPTDSASNTQQAQPQGKTQPQASTPSWKGKTIDELTDEEIDQMIHDLSGGGVTVAHPDSIDMDAARDLAGVMKH